MDANFSGGQRLTSTDHGTSDAFDLDALGDRIMAQSRYFRLPSDVQAALVAPLLALSTDDLLAYGDKLLGAQPQRFKAAA